MFFSSSLPQSVAELEQKWQSEVEDAMQGKLENNMPFFYDYHFNEVRRVCIHHRGVAFVKQRCTVCAGVCTLCVSFPEMSISVSKSLF